MRNAPPEPAVTRFQADLQALIGAKPPRLGLAVSGGPDSIALLLLVQAAGLDCAAATVDHGLRPEGAAEAAFVAGICADLGVPHNTLKLGAREGGNLSDWARHARYAALAEWLDAQDCGLLLTAHHADDQLETMIMRLNRGAGVGGLSAVRARRGAIARPLLGWRKAELEALVAGSGITPMDDPSNRDDRFDRARLRKALDGASWLDPIAAARSAAALGEADDALAWAAKAYLASRVAVEDGVISLDPTELPGEILRRILLSCMRQIAPDAEPRGGELDRLISALEQGETATLGGVKCSGGALWRFSLAPPRNNARRKN